MRPLPHGEREEPDTDRDQQAWVQALLHAPDKRHGDRGGERSGEDHQPRLIGGEAQELLQIHRQHEDRGIEAGPEQARERDPGGEAAVGENPEIDHGVLRAQLVHDEPDEPHATRHGEREDLPRGEPVVTLAALEHRLQRADPDRQQRQTEPIHTPDLLRVTRVAQIREREQERDRPEGQIDVEDPGPGQHVGEPAAKGGAERGTDHHPHAEDRHRGAVLLRGKHLVEHGLGGGQQRAAPQSLHDPPRHERRQGMRVAAKEGGDREQCDRAREIAAAPEEGRQPAGDGQDDHVGHDVAGRDPRDLVERGAEAAHHVRDRHVHDARVEQLEHGSQRDRDRDQVPVPVEIVGGRGRLHGVEGGAHDRLIAW